MATFKEEECICAVCGTAKKYKALTSTILFGSPDLDLRPPDQRRRTMGTWIQECPACGYISSKVSDPAHVTIGWLRSKGYRTCDGIKFLSRLAAQFYKYYLINMHDKKTEEAFYAILHAAWACDDKNDDNNARHCREIAIPLVAQMIEEDCQYKDTILLVRADLMRRSGHFDEMVEMYSPLRFGEKLLDEALAFEIEMAMIGDTSCYRLWGPRKRRGT